MSSSSPPHRSKIDRETQAINSWHKSQISAPQGDSSGRCEQGFAHTKQYLGSGQPPAPGHSILNPLIVDQVQTQGCVVLLEGQPVALLINWKLSDLKLVFTYLRVLEHERQSNYTQALVHSSPSVHLRRKNEFSQRCLFLCEHAHTIPD